MLTLRIKNALRKSLLTEAVSYLVHNNLLAKSLNFSGEGNFDTSEEGLHAHGVKIADQYLLATPAGLQGQTILEVGCGLSLATACHLVKEAGAARVFAYDWFACRHANDEILARRYAEHADCVRYVTGDYAALASAVASGSIDRVFSNAVLEHVDDLDALFEVLDGLLAPGGTMYHRVDLRCHNRFRRQGELYFHTFGHRLWRAMGNNVGHPNRCLLDDYANLFERHGFLASITKVQTFPPDVLANAQHYLKNRDIRNYNTAVFDVVLTRDLIKGV